MRYTKFTLEEFEQFGLNSKGEFFKPEPKINREVIKDIWKYEERKSMSKSPIIRKRFEVKIDTFKSEKE